MPGEVHGQRILAGCSPFGHEESDTTKQLTRTHRRGYREQDNGFSILKDLPALRELQVGPTFTAQGDCSCVLCPRVHTGVTQMAQTLATSEDSTVENIEICTVASGSMIKYILEKSKTDF